MAINVYLLETVTRHTVQNGYSLLSWIANFNSSVHFVECPSEVFYLSFRQPLNAQNFGVATSVEYLSDDIIEIIKCCLHLMWAHTIVISGFHQSISELTIVSRPHPLTNIKSNPSAIFNRSAFSISLKFHPEKSLKVINEMSDHVEKTFHHCGFGNPMVVFLDYLTAWIFIIG